MMINFFYKMFGDSISNTPPKPMIWDLMIILTIVMKQFQLVRGNAAQQDHYQRSLPAVLETLQVF